MTKILNYAIELMNFKGTITLVVDDTEMFATILIEDHGKGIPKNIQSQIFDAGFTYDKSSGSGIGLSQAKEAISKKGGDLNLISSEPGKTIFKITLPKSNLNSLEIVTAKNIVLLEDASETAQVWKKIFEDHHVNFLYFESYEKFKIHMEKFKFNPFNNAKYTLITDLIFNGEDETGFEAVQLIKNNEAKHLHNTFICTTLSSNKEIIRVAQDLGVQIFGKKDLDKIRIVVT